MRESKVESHLRRRIEAAGGECWKFTSSGLIGVPDRIVMLPDGRLWFIELKAADGRVSTPQGRRHKTLWALGQKVLVLNTIEAVDQFVDGVTK
jgi:hypothetical protein